MQKTPDVVGDRKKPFLLHSPPNHLGLLATRSRSTLAVGHAIAFNLQPSTFNLLTLGYWPRNRVQPPNLQP
ncbi:MAG: hypothetical protein F6K63_33630 [Moorea sp. SIO1G6]|uniref:hypothetical protein n=1 Tax=unclassified Moorena TaxID=2683338 RepID=UPI0013BE460E|nr:MULTISPECIES: hypothetical protein [unclassified Moorena]NEQ08873.1 hypothetical protein [Moorena sp. SIO4E2]NET69076.1 hypothetical protein [Moorena sp. SIO1G6]